MKNSKKGMEKMQSEAILNNDYSIKNKYLVNVFIQKVDSKANRNSENVEYFFDEGSLLEKRRNAIQKAQEIMNEFNNSTGKDSFSSFSEAEAKKFKNYKCYSIDISLIKEYENDEYVYDYAIYGNDEITHEALEVEAKFFREMNEDVKFTEIKNPDGETIEVLEESLFFLL
jgi:hypothetical protein